MLISLIVWYKVKMLPGYSQTKTQGSSKIINFNDRQKNLKITFYLWIVNLQTAEIYKKNSFTV